MTYQRHRAFFAPMLIAILSLSLIEAWAQSTTTATITGFVFDPSGSAVPQATVNVANSQTGFARSVNTSDTGVYTVPQLPIAGSYDVSVSKDGFQTYRRTGIVLEVNQVARVDVALVLGAMTQTIEVKEAAPMLELATSDLGDVVEQRRLTELPLNGRNPLQLVGLVAGTTTFSAPSVLPSSRAGGSATVNGNRSNTNAYKLDGNNLQGTYFNTALNFPNPDALEEFKLITHNYSAEFGRNAGAVMNAVTKSGTNSFHGSVYEFLRNKAMNARPFFSKTVPNQKWNQFGATAGGPIVRNKLFIFGAYQGFRIPGQSLVSNRPVPTVLQRAGNFSESLGAVIPGSFVQTTEGATVPKQVGMIIDPVTGNVFSSGGVLNVIPPAQLSPITFPFLNTYVPLPNNADGKTITLLRDAPTSNNQSVVRVDYEMASNHRLSGRWYLDRTRVVNPFAASLIDWNNSKTNTRVYDFSVTETWTISPTLVNQAHFGRNHADDPVSIQEGSNTLKVSNKSLGINFPDQVQPPFGPWFSVSGVFDTFTNPGFEGGGSTSISDSLHWVHGKHSFKFGVEVDIDTYNNNVTPFAQGAHTFNGTFTGNALADFELGRSSEFSAWDPIIQFFRTERFSPFIQDDIKLTSRLTLNLGFRWEINRPWVPFREDSFYYKHPAQAWVPGQQSTVVPEAPVGHNYVGDPGVPDRLYKTPLDNLQPRIGFAWDPLGTGKWVIRGAYGIFSSIPVADTLTYAMVTQPFQGIAGTPLRSPIGGVADPYLGVPGGNPFPARPGNAFFLPETIYGGITPDFKDARIHQFNFGVQRALGRDTVLNVAYVGNLGRRLYVTRQLNPAKYIPGNDPVTGAPLSTNGNLESRRIIQPGVISGIRQAQSIGTSDFHSLQVTVERRWTEALSFSSAYTWSHGIDMQSAISFDGGESNCQNPYKCDDRGSSDFDRRHVYVASWVYDLPQSSARGVLGQLVNDWSITGIFRATTGSPFTAATGQGRALQGGGGERPNLVGDPYAGVTTNTQDRLVQWLNPAAFALNDIGTFGNLGRNSLYTPGTWNWDSSILKSFPLSEKYGRFQFRAEFFNLPNHANLFGPDANISSANFGKIGGRSGPRAIQLGLKYIW